MNEDEVILEDSEILDDPSIETPVDDKKDEQIANLNKALRQERENNKRLKESAISRPNPVNDDGSIDPNVFAQNILEQNDERVQRILQDDREWNRAVKKFSELEDDPDLEDAVRGMKTAALVNRGEVISYEEAADRVLGKLNKKTEKAAENAKEQGRTEAQVSEKIQERAVIDAPSGGKEDVAETRLAELRKVLYSPDSSDREREAAREQIISLTS